MGDIIRKRRKQKVRPTNTSCNVDGSIRNKMPPQRTVEDPAIPNLHNNRPPRSALVKHKLNISASTKPRKKCEFRNSDDPDLPFVKSRIRLSNDSCRRIIRHAERRLHDSLNPPETSSNSHSPLPKRRKNLEFSAPLRPDKYVTATSPELLEMYENRYKIGRVRQSDIELGKLLGQGAFSSVYQIQSLNMNHSFSSRQDKSFPSFPLEDSVVKMCNPLTLSQKLQVLEEEQKMVATRKEQRKQDKTMVSESCSATNKGAQEVVSTLASRRSSKNHRYMKKIANHASDLVKEGLFLASLRHDHVLSVFAWTPAGLMGLKDSYGNPSSCFCLILEKIHHTLADQIKIWKETKAFVPEEEVLSLECKSKSGKKPYRGSVGYKSRDRMLQMGHRIGHSIRRQFGRLSWQKELAASCYDDHEAKEFLHERTTIASNLADAVQYLHSKKILHRDIKPANIGFDRHGTVKLFDLDISRLIPTQQYPQKRRTPECGKDETDENIVFSMTKRMGSPRYMSPECGRGDRYNLKADVYSFGVVLYYILSLRKPYDDIPAEQHAELVFHEGYRPQILQNVKEDRKYGSILLWPDPLQELVQSCWSHDVVDRPSMSKVYETLSKINDDCQQGALHSVSSNEREPHLSRTKMVPQEDHNRCSNQKLVQHPQKKKNMNAKRRDVQSLRGRRRRRPTVLEKKTAETVDKDAHSVSSVSTSISKRSFSWSLSTGKLRIALKPRRESTSCSMSLTTKYSMAGSSLYSATYDIS